jgi:hypothetical protein
MWILTLWREYQQRRIYRRQIRDLSTALEVLRSGLAKMRSGPAYSLEQIMDRERACATIVLGEQALAFLKERV